MTDEQLWKLSSDATRGVELERIASKATDAITQFGEMTIARLQQWSGCSRDVALVALSRAMLNNAAAALVAAQEAPECDTALLNRRLINCCGEYAASVREIKACLNEPTFVS